MARQLKLPMARVLPARTLLEDVMPAPSERVMLVDMDRVRASKTYAQLKAQAVGWDEADCDGYVLALLALGCV